MVFHHVSHLKVFIGNEVVRRKRAHLPRRFCGGSFPLRHSAPTKCLEASIYEGAKLPVNALPLVTIVGAFSQLNGKIKTKRIRKNTDKSIQSKTELFHK